MAKTKKQPVTIGDFHKMLVLAKWANGVFNRMSFEALSARLRNADLEGLADGDTRTKFSHAILDGNLFYLGDDAICTETQPRTLFDLPGNVKTVPHVIHEDFSYLQMLQPARFARREQNRMKKFFEKKCLQSVRRFVITEGIEKEKL